MPNIELHGYAEQIMTGLIEKSSRLERVISKVQETTERIWQVLEGAEYLSEVVVTLILSNSDTPNRKPAPPYLRIWATTQEEVDDIVKRLEPLDIDIELPPLLAKWLPRQSARQKTAGESVIMPSD